MGGEEGIGWVISCKEEREGYAIKQGECIKVDLLTYDGKAFSTKQKCEGVLLDNGCSRAGGKWKRFSSGCADSCFLARATSNPLCTMVLTDSCDCGPDKCWDGQTCVDNQEEDFAGRIELKILSDSRCENCDISKVLTRLRDLFPKLIVIGFDYNSEEGKKLYDKNDLHLLPAFLFDDDVKQQSNYHLVERYLEPKGDLFSLRIGASFDPTIESV